MKKLFSSDGVISRRDSIKAALFLCLFSTNASALDCEGWRNRCEVNQTNDCIHIKMSADQAEKLRLQCEVKPAVSAIVDLILNDQRK